MKMSPQTLAIRIPAWFALVAVLANISVAPQLAYANGNANESAVQQTEQPKQKWYERGAGFVKRVSDRCSDALDKAPTPIRKLVRGLGWATLVIPASRSLSDPNRFHNILYKRPMMGTITASTGVALSYELNKHLLNPSDPWHNGQGSEWDMEMFGKRSFEIWFSFNTSNITRTALALQTDINPLVRFLLDWWASSVSYIIGTAVPDFMRAASTGSQELMTVSLAKSLFAVQWPVISRPIGQWLSIYLFSRFLTQQSFDRVKAPGFDLPAFVAEKQAALSVSETRIPELSAKATSARQALGYALRGRDINGKLPEQLTKNEVAGFREQAMIRTEGSRRIVPRQVLDRLNEWFTAREALRKERAKTKQLYAEIKWATWLRAGLNQEDAVSRPRRAMYQAMQQVVETTVGGSVLVLYLLLRDASVGESFDPSRLNQQGAGWLLKYGGFFPAMQDHSADLTADATPHQLAEVAADLQPVMEEQLEATPGLADAISEYVSHANPAEETMLLSTAAEAR